MIDVNIIEDEWLIYMYLLKCSIYNEVPDIEVCSKYSHVTVDTVINDAVANNQRLLMEKAIQEYAKQIGSPIPSTNRAQMFYIMKKYEIYKELRQIFDGARERGIKLCVFKGCVLAGLYPEYVRRNSCDTDILVAREEKEQALSYFREMGYEENPEHSNSEVTYLYKKAREHAIELHTCLWEDYEGKRLDILESFGLDNPETFIEVEACGFWVTTLGIMEHLIFQLFHIIKHFSLEGVGAKYLADITLYVNRYHNEIDKELFWKRMDEIGYTKFTYSLFVVCSEFLGMDSSIMRGHEIPIGDEIRSFMLDILCKEEIKEEKDAKWQILGMMTPYFTGESKAADCKWKRKLQVVFPKAKDLPDQYQYARKCRILLPVAWVHKAVNYLLKYQKNKDNWYSTTEKLDVAEHRMKLMKDMGLI